MPKSAIQNVLEKFTAFTRNGERLGSIATMFLTFMIVADITMRRFFSSPFSFSFEVVQFTLVICAYGYIAYTTSVARHISVETLTVKFSAAARKWLRTVGDCLTIILLGLISWQGKLIRQPICLWHKKKVGFGSEGSLTA